MVKLKDQNGEEISVNQRKREKCPIPKKVEDLLVKQLSHELYNHNLYKTFSVYFAVEGLYLLEKYYDSRAREEYKHAEWILKYMKENDVVFQYPAVEPINMSIDNHLSTFELTLKTEIETTELIKELYSVAVEEKDLFTQQWLMDNNPDTGMLIKEQVEEESISRTILDLASCDEPWLKKQKAILGFYEG